MSGVSIDDLAGDVAQVIATLGRGPAVVLGHVFGRGPRRGHQPTRSGVRDHPGRRVRAHHRPGGNAAPFRASDPRAGATGRLAARRLAFFAPDHDPSARLNDWYPQTLAMRHAALTGVDLGRYWRAGSAPGLELIAELDPLHQKRQWGDLRAECGDRVTTTLIEHASHALLPEQPSGGGQRRARLPEHTEIFAAVRSMIAAAASSRADPHRLRCAAHHPPVAHLFVAKPAASPGRRRPPAHAPAVV